MKMERSSERMDSAMKSPDRLHKIFRKAESLKDEIIAWRRELHIHPELGFGEHWTSNFIADRLQEMGLPYQVGVGGTGIVAAIGEQGKPAVGVRADLDALPIQEENSEDEISYASQNPGVMHACGHDTHVAMLLGAAKALKDIDELPPGEIRLLFQPSEERSDENKLHGAERMIQDGALDGLDAVIALHIDSTLPSGKVWMFPGYAFAGGDYWEASIIGRGGHDSLVHQTIDPIFISAQVINAIYGIRARRLDPAKFGSISIGSIHAGKAGNVVPSEVKLNGTIRSLEDETRAQIALEMERAFGVAKALGGDYKFDIKHGVVSLYNDPDISETFSQVAADLLGESALVARGPALAVEDFAYMARQAPGAMIMLGAQIGDQIRPMHNPRFNVDESVFPIGSALLAETACRLLSQFAGLGE